MLRTIVSFDPAEKAWLDHEARMSHVPMTEIVRKAVLYYREKLEKEKQPEMCELLKKTAGTWKHKGDALNYQNKLRQEWDK